MSVNQKGDALTPTTTLTDTDIVIVVTNPNQVNAQTQSITKANLALALNSEVFTFPRLGQLLFPSNIGMVAGRRFKQQFDVAQTNFTLTWRAIFKAPVLEFQYVRFLLGCGEAVGTTISGMLVATTTSNADKVAPTTGNTNTGDTSTGWLSVTSNGNTSWTLAPGTATQPSLQWTDWMLAPSLPVTDASGNPYAMYCLKMGNNFSSVFCGSSNTDNTKETYIETTYKTGDFVTTPASMTTASGVGTGVYNPVFGVEFMSSSRIITGLCVGSSTTQGVGSSPTDCQFRSWVPRVAEAAIAGGVPLNMMNVGYSAQSSTTYAAYGKTAVAAHKPSMAFYQVYSPNDGTITQTIANAQFARAIDFANYCISLGILPILVFTAPNNNLTGPQDLIRKALITRCKATTFTVLDMTTAVGDGADPERYQPAFDSGDGLHPNDAGYAAMTTVASALITTLLSLNIKY